jgi:hypothetical protein
MTGGGTLEEAPYIYVVEPSTRKTSAVLNTYFGLASNGPKDVI